MNVPVPEHFVNQSLPALTSAGKPSHRWAVILAGGDGTRLKPLTRLACGDSRPKQFCPLLNGKTLLSETRTRIARSINSEQTLFVLTKHHAPYFASELADVPMTHKVVQPRNQGTLPAILWSLLRLMRLDPNSLVAFFPSDHHFTDEAQFMAAIERSFDFLEDNRGFVILLGAAADRPETEYGWIEPETSIAPLSDGFIAPVKRFWEKPPIHIARELYARRCLWNTFVMIGRAETFVTMIRESSPMMFELFNSAVKAAGDGDDAVLVSSLYDLIQPADFSRQVLSANPGRLRVASCGHAGWSDLGDPRRLARIVMKQSFDNPSKSSDVCTRCGLSAKQILQMHPATESTT